MRLCLVAMLPIVFVAHVSAADLTGTWTFEWKPDFSGHPTTINCQVTQEQQALTIRCNEATMRGTVRGRTVTFEHTTGLKNELTVSYKATVDEKGTSMTGTWRLSKPANKEGKFEAHKQ